MSGRKGNRKSHPVDHPGRAAYGLPEIEEAIKAGTAGLKNLAERAGLSSDCDVDPSFSLLPAKDTPRARMLLVGSAVEEYICFLLKDAVAASDGTPLKDDGVHLPSWDQVMASLLNATAHGTPLDLGDVLRPRLSDLFAHSRNAPKGSLLNLYIWACDTLIQAKHVSDLFKSCGDHPGLMLKNPRAITRMERDVFTCLRNALSRPAAGQDNGWQLVQILLKHDLDFLRRIEAAIAQKDPIEAADAGSLAEYLGLGRICVDHQMEPGGPQWFFKLSFMPEYPDDLFEVRLGSAPKHVAVARVLAAPAAFEVAMNMQQMSDDGRNIPYLRRCHAPLCRKLFFSARAIACCCESQQKGLVSKCKSEWDRYKTWLKKSYCGKNANDIWNDPMILKIYANL